MARSRTAQYVAVMRAVLHDRGVLADPCAKAMLTTPMRVTASIVGRLPVLRSPFTAGLAARIVWFDEQVRSALEAGLPQVVTIGAGYDARAWRFAREGARFFEVDHPATQRDKVRRAPAVGPVYVPADLAVTAVTVALALRAYRSDRPALFVIEGVSMYLDRVTLGRVLRDLSSAAPGSRLAINFAPPRDTGDAAERRRQRTLRALGRASGERHQLLLSREEAAQLVDSSGWPGARAVALADVAAHRWPDGPFDVGRLNPEASAVTATLA